MAKKHYSLTLDNTVIEDIKIRLKRGDNLSARINDLIIKGLESEHSIPTMTMKQALLQVQEVYKRDILKVKDNMRATNSTLK